MQHENELFVLQGGQQGTVVKLYQTSTEVGTDTYRTTVWMPTNVVFRYGRRCMNE